MRQLRGDSLRELQREESDVEIYVEKGSVLSAKEESVYKSRAQAVVSGSGSLTTGIARIAVHSSTILSSGRRRTGSGTTFLSFLFQRSRPEMT